MQLKTEVVEFRDGTKITVSEENWDIGERLIELEKQSNADRLAELELAKKENRDPDFSAWGRRVVYNKMLACSSGDVPTEEEVRKWPTLETNKWYEAVRRVNPQWFTALDALMDEKAKVQKKARKRHA